MDKKNFLRLLDKYLEGTATSAEQRLIEEYYRRLDVDDRTQFSAEQENALKQLMLQNIRKGIKEPVQLSQSGAKRIPLWLRSVAALLIFASAGLYFWKNQQPDITLAAHKTQPVDIRPGGNEAVLTLADGTRIALKDAKNGILVTEGVTSVKKTKDGQVVYDISAQPVSGQSTRSLLTTDNPPLTYNTISTPMGGQYQVILPDGTKVWLNAASALTFPTAFIGKERKVKLKGEAYFEVAKNEDMPFRVDSRGQTVEVLGTHFNVMAYDDEASVNTTLLEGSVRVIKGNNSKIIKPGEQSRVKGADIEIINADTRAVTAWKDGYFVFKNEELSSIMRKISRWYGAKTAYVGNAGEKTFGGKISRSRNVSEVLKMLELTGSVHFKIEGIPSEKERRIIVMP